MTGADIIAAGHLAISSTRNARRHWTFSADHLITLLWSIPCLLTTSRHGADQMGVVVSFEEKKRARPHADSLATANDGEHVVAAAMHAATNQLDVLKAARPLLDRCRDRYGFVVMRDGLPQHPDVLVRALLSLSRGLAVLDVEMGAPRTYPTFGVYFGRRRLGWFEDGYSGTTGLAVPNDTEALALASFVRSRICVAQVRSQE